MKRKFFSIAILAAMSAFGFGTAFAQDAAKPADAPAAAAPEVTNTKTLLDYWLLGGWTMYPLGLCAIAGVSIAIVNAISIRTSKFMAQKDIDTLTDDLNNLRVTEALKYCEKRSNPLTNIVGAGLARVNDKELDLASIEEAMGEASIEEMAAPYVLVNYLALIASISPMLGLFGTVLGMVKAFDTIASEGAGSASTLANNISEALITTAAGMIIGVPAMLFYFIFKNKYGQVTSGLSRTVGDLLYTYKMSTKYGPQEIVSTEETPVATENQ